MADEEDIYTPVVLELALLPREQIGPYLLLGLDKAAEKDDIDAAWAQRIIWARQRKVKVLLEDVNWAREAITEPDKRVLSDVCSINTDTASGILKSINERYADAAKNTAGASPIDVERPLSNYSPETLIPDPEEVRQSIPDPEIPQDIPAVESLLKQFAQRPIDPWDLDVS